VSRGADSDEVAKKLLSKFREVFELAPDIVVLPTGTLAREGEQNIKAARFLDRRG
jgi:hypothetical protein